MTNKRDSAFAALEKLRQSLPPGPAPQPKRDDVPRAPARAVVRLERKQRGGKEVTVVEKLGLDGKALAEWCKDLKSALGCGGSVENDTIVLQGDLRQRIGDVLAKRGVGKVTIGT